MTPDWLPTSTFAQIAGIERRVATRVLGSVASANKVFWRGAALEVRRVNGIGGANGMNYLVKASSLPLYLQERLKASQTPFEGRSSRPLSDAARERTWWLHVLGPSLEHPKGTAGRKAALSDIASRPVFDWNGNRFNMTVRTLQRRLARMEGEGSIAPLARTGRSDRGEKRVAISRRWDAAVPFDDALKAKIAGDLKAEIRTWVANGAARSKVLVFASRFLRKATEANGFRPNDPAVLATICKVPKHLYEAESVYKKVHQHRTDKKASYDAQPRIRRTTKGLRPMEWVVADVHHCNVLLEKKGDLRGTPKLISFMDVATRRVWSDLVFLDERGGVRNVDVIETFLAMAQHPAFGLPETIYVDNGKEFNFADFLNDALQLALPCIASDGRADRTIRALPRNAAAKPIEAWFGHFEQQYLQHCQGYIGDDRLNPKQEILGRLPAPYPGGFPAFQERFFGLLHAYETAFRQGGDLAGKTPAEAFATHVADGWSAAVMDHEAALTAFTRPVTRRVSQGAFSVGGRFWTCHELAGYLGDRVTIHVPAYHGYNELLVRAPDGTRIGIATPDQVFTFNDPRGAQRSAERKSLHNKALAALGRAAPKVDVAGLIVAAGEEHLPTIPNAPRATVSAAADEAPARMLVPNRREAKTAADLQTEQDEIRAIRRASAQAVRLREAG